MNDVIDFPDQRPNIVGPENVGNAVIVEGRLIPNMSCIDRGDTIDFIIDGRFLYGFPKEWAYLAAAMAAQCMAIGAGYSYMGAATKDRPFAPEVAQIGDSK